MNTKHTKQITKRIRIRRRKQIIIITTTRIRNSQNKTNKNKTNKNKLNNTNNNMNNTNNNKKNKHIIIQTIRRKERTRRRNIRRGTGYG